MANMKKTEIAELKGKIYQLNLKNRNLQENIKALTDQHVKDQAEIKKLNGQMDDAIKGLQEAMMEIYCKSIAYQYGEDVHDDETGEYLGKRLVFKALRKNDWKLNLNEDLIFPEDEKYISTITVGLTAPQKGEDDEKNL